MGQLLFSVIRSNSQKRVDHENDGQKLDWINTDPNVDHQVRAR